MTRSGRTIATAGLVMLACYAGASLGTWFRFPELGAAAIFPPYAVVVAVLWKSPPRRWWLYLLAASAGNYLAHRADGASVQFVVLAELVNHLRAVIAAVGLRRFAGSVRTLREMGAYLLFAALLAPCIGALGGATIATELGTSTDFAMTWQQWCLSNTTTALTILPLLSSDLRRVAALPSRLWVEIAVFVGALLLAAYATHALAHPWRMYWALPFLLWSAARFGWRGTSVALLGIVALSVSHVFTGDISTREELLELHVFLIATSTPLFMLAVLTDQQLATTAELVESRRQYQSVVDDQTDLICRFLPDGTYTFTNRAYRQAFAISDPTGKSVWSEVPAGVHRAKPELDRLTLASPIASHEVAIGADRDAGRWLQWLERALFDKHGNVIEYQAVGRDITDRKHAEDKQRELEARRSVEAVMRETDRRKDEFLAMLGHELRNPLAPMGLALELLGKPTASSGEHQWARESMQRQLQRLTQLTDELLDLSRVTLGKIQIHPHVIDLREVIENAVEESRSMYDANNLALSIRLVGDPVWVLGDSVRLAQVFANLLDNAAKYAEPGGEVTVAVELTPADVRVAVRDNGIGLDPDAIETIFELFSQTDAARERGRGGLGIGLTLVRRLVELHGGTVIARSEGKNCGSEFVVTLPRTERPAAESTPEPPVVPAPVALRILAVDDNIDIARGLAAVLAMWGHTVQTAHDGVAALELATDFAPDVVMLDIGLPRLNGLEVARRLRDPHHGSSAVLVAITGFGEPQTRAGVVAAGFHHHFVKPIDLERLRVLLETCARDKIEQPGALRRM